MELTEYSPGAWKFIHASAGNATEQHKRDAFVAWMRLMPAMFPCDRCGEHLRMTIQAYPPENYADSAENLLKWTYIAHDGANNHWNSDNRGRPRKCSPPWSEVKDTYLSVFDDQVVEVRPQSPRATSSRPQSPRAASGRTLHAMHQQYLTHPYFNQFKTSFRRTRR